MATQSAEVARVYRQLSRPFFALLVFSFIAIAGLVLFVTHIQNQKSINASVHLAKAVLAASERDLKTTAFDNGYWDQAVENMVTNINLDWGDNNIGTYLFENADVSSTYVLDAKNTLVYSSIDGERQTDDPLVRFSGGLERLIEQARSGEPTEKPIPALGLIHDRDHVSIAVAIRMTGYFLKGGIEAIQATNSVLIVTRKIDKEILQSWAANYLLPDLKLVPAGEALTGALVPLIAVDGSVLGALSWRPNLPGDEVLPTLLIAIITAFAFMGLVAYFFLSRTRRVAIQLSQAKAEADYANHAKTDFLANMSHELRTPLNAILGFSGIMQNEMYGPLQNSKYREFVKDIEGAGTHLLELINEVLDLAKIEAGRKELDQEEVNLFETLRSTTKYVKHWAIEKDVALDIALSQENPVIKADKTAVRQIILNLVTNAVKFTPTGGRVSCLCSSEEDGSVIFRVSDNGIGIEKTNLTRVLEPFGQIASAETRGHKGSGLGLPISKKLTELLGGSFLLESEFGVGTQVTVRFPPDIVIQGTPVPEP